MKKRTRNKKMQNNTYDTLNTKVNAAMRLRTDDYSIYSLKPSHWAISANVGIMNLTQILIHLIYSINHI